MTADDYYRILGISSSSSIDDIKKAYRQKARMYHPDINPSDDAKDMFISATEAYEFLISNASKFLNDDKAYDQAMEDWRKYRQDRSRHRAKTYARASYVQFRNTKFYRSTRILDGTTIIFGLVISIFMVIFTICGYYYRLKHPLPGTENPTFLSFIMLLLLSALFFVLSVVFLKVYIETSRKRKKKTV